MATKSLKVRSAEQVKGRSHTQDQERSQEQARRPAPNAPYSGVLSLQHAAGNQAVSQLLQSGMGNSSISTHGVPPIVQSVLNSGSGKPLDSATRTYMESRFNHDFSQVRIHQNASAAALARSKSAKAYTQGQDIVFGEGEYAPQEAIGRVLLAHELAHVVQQSRPGGSQPNAMHEQEADLAANLVNRASNITISLGSSPGVIQCSPDQPGSKPPRKIFVDSQILVFIANGIHPEAEKKLLDMKKDGAQIFVAQQTYNEILSISPELTDPKTEPERQKLNDIKEERVRIAMKLKELDIKVGPKGSLSDRTGIYEKNIFEARLVETNEIDPETGKKKQVLKLFNRAKKPLKKGQPQPPDPILSEPDLLKEGGKQMKGRRNDVLVAAQVVAAGGELFTLDGDFLEKQNKQAIGPKKKLNELGLRIAPESWQISHKPNVGTSGTGSTSGSAVPSGSSAPPVPSKASASTAKPAIAPPPPAKPVATPATVLSAVKPPTPQPLAPAKAAPASPTAKLPAPTQLAPTAVISAPKPPALTEAAPVSSPSQIATKGEPIKPVQASGPSVSGETKMAAAQMILGGIGQVLNNLADDLQKRAARTAFYDKLPGITKALKEHQGSGAVVIFSFIQYIPHPDSVIQPGEQFAGIQWFTASSPNESHGKGWDLLPSGMRSSSVRMWVPPLPIEVIKEEKEQEEKPIPVGSLEGFLSKTGHLQKDLQGKLSVYEALKQANAAVFTGYQIQIGGMKLLLTNDFYHNLLAAYEGLIEQDLVKRVDNLKSRIEENQRKLDGFLKEGAVKKWWNDRQVDLNPHIFDEPRAHEASARIGIQRKFFADAFKSIREAERLVALAWKRLYHYEFGRPYDDDMLPF